MVCKGRCQRPKTRGSVGRRKVKQACVGARRRGGPLGWLCLCSCVIANFQLPTSHLHIPRWPMANGSHNDEWPLPIPLTLARGSQPGIDRPMATYLLIGPQEVPAAAKMTALGISAVVCFVSHSPLPPQSVTYSPFRLYHLAIHCFTGIYFLSYRPFNIIPSAVSCFPDHSPELSPRVQPPARGIARSNDITLQPVGQKASVGLISQPLPQWPRPMKSRRGKESETAHQCT